MYLKSAEFQGVGPIDALRVEFGFTGEGNPKPCVLVGENGSGKSLVIAHIVNALVSAKGVIYEDAETEKGKVYKLRSPQYIKSGHSHSFAEIILTNELKFLEWVLGCKKSEYLVNHGQVPQHDSWARIPEHEYTFFESNAHVAHEKVRELFDSGCVLYFPPNRAEEPAWLNADNLSSKARLSNRRSLSTVSGRNLICASPLDENKNWLFDVVTDRQIRELKTALIRATPEGQQSPISFQAFVGFDGPNASLFEQVNLLVKDIFKGQPLRVTFGSRANRKVSLTREDSTVVPNIFQLSTGELQLLNMVLSILRDSEAAIGHRGFNDVSGIVVIDEVDTNLHSSMQIEVLPALMKKFPKVQFVVSTHSPLLLLGLERSLGADSVDIVEMPGGKRISAEAFSEFGAAYEAFKLTRKAQEQVEAAVKAAQRPVVYLEGATDIAYLRRAAELLGRTSVLDQCELVDGDGVGNLEKTWKAFDGAPQFSLASKVLLVFDCDTGKTSLIRERISKFVIPINDATLIRKGIENLFSQELIDRARAENSAFIDTTEATTSTVRGEEMVVSRTMQVNKDEKTNLCRWICANGELADFEGFGVVIDRIAQLVQPS